MPLPFAKYHALGNDYLVMDAAALPRELRPDEVVRICHRHFGIGSDGLLLLGGIDHAGTFVLTIKNPDGSEAEKRGNGLRIFSRYLFDRRLVTERPFAVATKGGLVRCAVLAGGREVSVEMGTVSFESGRIPVRGPEREVLRERMTVLDREFEFSAATIGNPHCVLLVNEARAEDAERFGPLIEADPRFPNRTNVQFLGVLDRRNIRIEIWERGAGYTLASGSSSSAAAAVARRLGLCDPEVTVHMPGGELAIAISDRFEVTMRGPVTRVGEGVLDEELFIWKSPPR